MGRTAVGSAIVSGGRGEDRGGQRALGKREKPPLRRSEGSVAPQPPERAEEIREGPAKEEASGLSERHIDAEGERRLIEAGFLPEASHVGKRRWKDPDTGRSMPRGARSEEHTSELQSPC